MGTGGVLRVPDPWIGMSRHLVLRRRGTDELLPVPVEEGSTLGVEFDAVYRLEFERVTDALSSGVPLPLGGDDAVAQATALEAVDQSGHSQRPVVVGGAEASSGSAT